MMKGGTFGYGLCKETCRDVPLQEGVVAAAHSLSEESGEGLCCDSPARARLRKLCFISSILHLGLQFSAQRLQSTFLFTKHLMSS